MNITENLNTETKPSVWKKKNLIPAAIIAAGLIIAAAIIFVERGSLGFLSGEKAAGKAIDYINQNKDILTGGNSVSLISVTDENGIYKISFKIGESEDSYTSYVTKDGRYLFPGGYDLMATTTNSNSSDSNNNGNSQPTATCETVNKAEKSALEAFVVSKCPYGLQMQRILYEIVKNIPSLAKNIKVRYIGSVENNQITSMHGDEEAQENLRQICIREEQSDKYWNYIGCHIKTGKVDDCLTSANVNKTQLNTCVTDASKGLTYAEADFNLQEQYLVAGSPTLFLNGGEVSEFDFGGRTAEAAKNLLCCGFSQTPGVCTQKLTENSAATGYSEDYAGSGDSASGDCN